MKANVQNVVQLFDMKADESPVLNVVGLDVDKGENKWQLNI